MIILLLYSCKCIIVKPFFPQLLSCIYRQQSWLALASASKAQLSSLGIEPVNSITYCGCSTTLEIVPPGNVIHDDFMAPSSHRGLVGSGSHVHGTIRCGAYRYCISIYLTEPKATSLLSKDICLFLVKLLLFLEQSSF